jgi:hypothetical protein
MPVGNVKAEFSALGRHGGILRQHLARAGNMGELLDTSALRGQIAWFLRTQKNDESNGGDKE